MAWSLTHVYAQTRRWTMMPQILSKRKKTLVVPFAFTGLSESIVFLINHGASLACSTHRTCHTFYKLCYAMFVTHQSILYLLTWPIHLSGLIVLICICQSGVFRPILPLRHNYILDKIQAALNSDGGYSMWRVPFVVRPFINFSRTGRTSGDMLWKRVRNNGLANVAPFITHGLTLIRTWIRNFIQYKVWGEITYPSPKFNVETGEVWEWICNFTLYFTGHDITYSYWDWSQSMLVKGVPEDGSPPSICRGEIFRYGIPIVMRPYYLCNWDTPYC